uniref:Uncharacterized protein n=1 Tax=Anguilla anguilla TaxID=7936 RepID=A0A0E9QUD5_ANGAN
MLSERSLSLSLSLHILYFGYLLCTHLFYLFAADPCAEWGRKATERW